MSAPVITAATTADVPAILSLLERCQLPPAGFIDHLADAFVARNGSGVVGTVTLESYVDGALLRSVAVERHERGTGLGQRLTEQAVARARARVSRRWYPLTTTAERFFLKFGFEVIDRSLVPATVRQSIEFTSACPASAIVMRKLL